jgi:hypothetical protein
MAEFKPTIARTEVATKDRLAAIAAADPSVTVYEYVTDTATEVMPADEQLYVYRSIVAAFDGATHAFPDESDEELRERVLNSSDKARKFQHLYAKVFASSTYRVSTDAEEERLDRTRKAIMLMMLEKVTKQGSEDEIAARVMHHSMRLAMRATTEEDRKSGTVIDPKDRPANMPEMTPMHPSELGASSVKQLRRVRRVASME